MPVSFWREFYKNVLQDREKKAQEYAARLAEKNKQAESAKLQASVKRIKPEANIVRKTIIRARDQPGTKAAKPTAATPTMTKSNGRLAKILEPAKKRLKMERKFKR
ncbi:hypothetical protein BVRB_019960 [Beta vulgaris subsp. vulgaris]|uniref:Uncharacterized protein n=1 Tax=Beta vulgaris subsp. vulgaris TaxID=3555 RepID=A0A0J8B415_BETVV|nr:hypothetical protein BVRB_019960 [Beta vulgaris subsp. vulgaris]